MKRIAFGLLSAALLLPSPARAELYVITTLLCDERSKMENDLKAGYGETLYSAGSGVQDHAVRLYRNLDKDTFTVTTDHGDGFDCILQSGDGWQDLHVKDGSN